MTVGVAYRVPPHGAVLVADGRVTHSGYVVASDTRKLVSCGATFVIVAGEVGATWRRLQETPPRSFAAFRRAMDGTKEETDWLAYDRTNDRLWSGDVRLSGLFAAVGSGDALALGALEALPLARTLEDATAAARRAVQIACKHNVECGGRIRILIVPRRGAPVSR